MKHYEITLTGKVQKVGLRFLSLKRAYELQIKGFVKYLEDKNSIYFEIEGEEENCKKFIYWLEKGARFATVESAKIYKSNLRYFPTFEIIHKTTSKFPKELIKVFK